MCNNRINRGIRNNNFIEALKNACFENSWLSSIIKNKNTFLAIRDEYVNIYMNGCSIMKLTYVNNSLRGQTHYKYLLKHRLERPYISSNDGNILMDNNELKNIFINHVDSVESFQYWSNIYGTDEDKGIFNIIKSNDNILDCQIAFSPDQEKSIEDETDDRPRRQVPRLDFCALQKGIGPNNYNLIFYEAKLFSNKELRSDGTGIPVVRQMQEYEQTISETAESIVASYKCICQNYVDLNLGLPIENIARDVCNSNLNVCAKPLLVIYGFDDDQKNGRVWNKHKEKLQQMLGKSRVILKGDPKGLKRGISKNNIQD